MFGKYFNMINLDYFFNYFDLLEGCFFVVFVSFYLNFICLKKVVNCCIKKSLDVGKN